MASPAVRNILQDENLNVHVEGASVKGTFTQKRGVLGGRKPLNDISNSGKPSTLQASKKHNLNVISIGEDADASKKGVFGSKRKSQVPVRRKALTDLTNSGKPSVQQVPKKKLQEKKLIAVAEENNFPDSILEEGFLHNHQECVRAQRKKMDMDQFLKTVGLDSDMTMQQASTQAFLSSTKSKFETSHEKEDMLEFMNEIHSPQTNRAKVPSGCNSPIFPGTPESPSSNTLGEEFDILSFRLTQSPELIKR